MFQKVQSQNNKRIPIKYIKIYVHNWVKNNPDFLTIPSVKISMWV